MKQLYIFNAYSIAAAYGIGTYIQQLMDCLVYSGIKVTIIYIRADKPCFTIEKKQNIRYIYIPSPKFGKPNDPFRNNMCFCRSISYLLIPYVEDQQNSIFHFNFMNDDMLCNTLKKTFSCKTILTVHYAEWAFPLFGNKKRFLEILSTPPDKLSSQQEKNIVAGKASAESLLHTADHIITVARHEAETLQQVYRVEKSKITTISNGVKDTYTELSDFERKKLRETHCIDEHEKLLLFVGRLDKMKGFPILLRAFEILLRTNKNIRLIAAGGGDIPGYLKKIDGYWSKITFTGFLEKDRLSKLYAIADVGVVPSMYEEFGYVAVEMMMRGLPVVANRTTGLAEIVEDRSTGLFVELSDNEALLEEQALHLCEKINHILSDETTRKKMAANARRKFLDKYEIELFKKNMLHFYQSVYTY